MKNSCIIVMRFGELFDFVKLLITKYLLDSWVHKTMFSNENRIPISNVNITIFSTYVQY